MALREDIQKKIEKKVQDLAELDSAYGINRASVQAYIQAMQDMLKVLPREASESRPANMVLRPGSAMAQARDVIQKAGRPLHIAEILRAMGRSVDKEMRTSVGGSLSNYVRRGEIFIRTAPNTFGLIGMEAAKEPPLDFGKVRAAELVPKPSSGDDDDDAAPDDE